MSVAPETTPQRVETDRERAAGIRAVLEGEPPAMITKSIAAFRRDLQELLKTHAGQWVAYHGDERIGFGRRQTPLYQECLRRGLTPDEFIVWGIEASGRAVGYTHQGTRADGGICTRMIRFTRPAPC